MNQLQLGRDQLGKVFGSDHESIRQIEKLLTLLKSIESINTKLSDLFSNLDALSNNLSPRVTNIESKLIPTKYGSFYDTTTQTAAVVNTGKKITFNSTAESNGVSIGSPSSRIYVTQSGLYNIQFSAQLDNTAGGNHLAYLWLRVNGSDIANSNSQARLKGQDGELVAAWNFYQRLNANDYFELVFSVSDLAVQLTAQGATGGGPAIPSVILTVTNIIVF